MEPHACKVSLQEDNISFKIDDAVHDMLVDYALAYGLHQMLFSSNQVPELVVEERAAKRSDVKASAAPIAGTSSMLYFVFYDALLDCHYEQSTGASSNEERAAETWRS